MSAASSGCQERRNNLLKRPNPTPRPGPALFDRPATDRPMTGRTPARYSEQVRLMVEFTTEPFELDTFPEHAVAARKVVDEAGLAVAVGPFGTGAEGEADQVLAAVTKLLRETLDAGATRISVQVSVLGEEGGTP